MRISITPLTNIGGVPSRFHPYGGMKDWNECLQEMGSPEMKRYRVQELQPEAGGGVDALRAEHYFPPNHGLPYTCNTMQLRANTEEAFCRAASRFDGLLAVMHKERRALQRQAWRWLAWLLTIAFFLLTLQWLYDLVFSTGGEAFSLAGVMLLGLLLIVPHVADAITREREAGTLDLLLLSRLSPAEIAGGKLLVSCEVPATTLVIALFLFMAMVPSPEMRTALHEQMLLLQMAYLLVTLLGAGMLALCCSALFPSMTSARATAFLLAGCWCTIMLLRINLLLPPVIAACLLAWPCSAAITTVYRKWQHASPSPILRWVSWLAPAFGIFVFTFIAWVGEAIQLGILDPSFNMTDDMLFKPALTEFIWIPEDTIAVTIVLFSLLLLLLVVFQVTIHQISVTGRRL